MSFIFYGARSLVMYTYVTGFAKAILKNIRTENPIAHTYACVHEVIFIHYLETLTLLLIWLCVLRWSGLLL